MLVGDILANRRNGVLTVIGPQDRKQLYWVEGELALVASSSAEESLGSYLLSRNLIDEDQARLLTPEDWTQLVPILHRGEFKDLHNKDRLLLDWTVSLALSLFSYEQGNAVLEEGPALETDRRVFVRSTPGFVLDGVRGIVSGLVLRRCLGDIRRRVAVAREPRFKLLAMPFSHHERQIATSLKEPEVIETFIKRTSADSVVAAKLIIAMLTLGMFEIHQEPPRQTVATDADPQRDLQLLAAIGVEDQRSLRIVALARQLPSMTHYEVLKLSPDANRIDVIKRVDEFKKRFDLASFPPIVREYVEAILKRLDQAGAQLADPNFKKQYDELLRQSEPGAQMTIDQSIMRRSMAETNFKRARDLSIVGDYYGAIVLLKQTVEFAPDHAEAWFLLGSCQSRNPQWRRDAMESLQKAVSINPNHLEALNSLGDLYQKNGLASRAESCYESVLQLDPENAHAQLKLKSTK